MQHGGRGGHRTLAGDGREHTEPVLIEHL
jgi:hypothetical protein